MAKKIKIPEWFVKPEIDPKEKLRQKKLSKSLVDMENQRFSTVRQLKAVNEVLALVTEESNPRVFRRATLLFGKLSFIK